MNIALRGKLNTSREYKLLKERNFGYYVTIAKRNKS